MKIALFGGSFDPLHVGHLHVIKEALKSLHVDKLLIVPAYQNPFKKEPFAPSDLRFKWIKKAFLNYEKVEILDYEIKQNKPTETIKTVLHVKEKYKNIKKIYLIIGADNLKNLHKWKDYKKLKKHVTFVIASRDNILIPKDLQKLPINVNISSSNLREEIDENFLPNTLKDEIKKHYTRIKMEKRIENIVNILDNKKAENIQIFDMQGKDYFVEQVVIASTMGERHGLALLDDLKKGLKKDETFLNIDDDNEWIVIDLGDILIHLMSQHYRSKYNIEEFLNEREEEMKKIREELEN